jgi:hypothetical protein
VIYRWLIYLLTSGLCTISRPWPREILLKLRRISLAGATWTTKSAKKFERETGIGIERGGSKPVSRVTNIRIEGQKSQKQGSNAAREVDSGVFLMSRI